MTTIPPLITPRRRFLALSAMAVLCATGLSVDARAASDPGRKACAQEARLLCPAEMKTLSRKKVEACMIARISQTSPTCHAAMLRIKAQREALVNPR